MIIQIIALSIILIKGTECIFKRQSCRDLNNQVKCEHTDNPYSQCSFWEGLCNNIQHNSCYQYQTEQVCQSKNDCFLNYMCYWNNGECLKRITNQNNYDNYDNQDKKCEDIDNYSECSHQLGNNQLCAWNHNHCQTIEKCSQITDFKQCRNAYIKDRCQYVINNVASKKEKEFIYSIEIFDFSSCRNQDCLFNTHYDCPEFRNGRRCFLKEGKCTQCSYQTNPNDCISTKKCTWQNSQCSNILCFQITSKRLCNQISYCQYDFTTQSCSNNNKNELSYCYNYNISSDPINTKYNSFI